LTGTVAGQQKAGKQGREDSINHFSTQLQKKRKHFCHLAAFWFGIFAMLFVLLGVLLVMKHLKMNGRLS